MPLIKVGKRRVVVIPHEVCAQVGVDIGDFVEVEAVERKIVMTPKKIVDADSIEGSTDRDES